MPGLLYAITPAGWPDARLLAACEQVLATGVDWLQYRDKPAPRADVAKALQRACARHGVPLLINDHLNLAAELGVGVHVGRDDDAVSTARARLGPDALVGASAYGDLQRARQAQTEGASHVAFGRLFDSRSKPDAPPAPLTVLREARRALQVPILGIGGITPANAARVIEAGAHGVACIDSVFGRDDPAAAVRSLRAAIDSARACQQA